MNQVQKTTNQALSPKQQEAVLKKLIKLGHLKEEDYDYAKSELIRHPNWNQIIKDNKGFDIQIALSTCQDFVSIFKNSYPRTEDEAMFSGYPSLASISKYKGRKAAISLLISLIAKTAEMINVGGNVRDDQLLPIAENVYGQFYHLNILEIKKAFNNGMKESMYRLDVAVFIGWLSEYDKIRDEISETKSLSQHISYNHKPEKRELLKGATSR